MSIRDVVESIVGSDETSEPASPDPSDGAGGDEFGGIDDDSLGGLDGDGGFDELDEDADEFGATEGGDAGQVAELEHRIDEVETEIDDLSSTVETVRTENERISASVADVEENVRKLLDIYEMVTNGVNPFADDVDAGAPGGSMGGDFGLFDDEGNDGSADGVDEDVAEADPEGFFDENLDEDDLTVDDEPAVDDVFGDESEQPSEADGATSPPDGGTSFEDLKAEYDAGEAVEESDSEREQDAGAQPAGIGETSAVELDETASATRPHREDADTAPPATSDGPRSTANSETGASPAAEARRESATHNPTDDEPETNGRTGTIQTPNDGGVLGRGDSSNHSTKPYLSSVPGGYATDLIVTEWLEPMVAKAGVREAASALEYYESIGWLAPAARERLEDRLGGFDGGGDGTLEIADHQRSLRYVSRLNGGGVAAVGPSTRSHGGGSDGVQR